MVIKAKDMAKILITGGAGFMGRWVAKNFVDKGHKVWILDNLSNSTEDSIKEFHSKLAGFVKGDIKDRALLFKLFENNFDICIHMAAAINVQESIDNTEKCFNENVVGTFNVLEECKKHNTKMVFMSSALVYETAKNGQAIRENHPLNPASPYTASKIFGEEFTKSFYRTYKFPVVILRPFSVYGPWQRSDSEGGVMSIFINKKLRSEPIEVFGTGEQTRDFLYTEDCAEFIVKAALSDRAVGEVFNAGSGQELRIRDLAEKIRAGAGDIKFVKHHHPHAEVMGMRADSRKAGQILKWKPRICLEEGIRRTREWLKTGR